MNMKKILRQDEATGADFDFLCVQPFNAVQGAEAVLDDINSIAETLNGTPLFIYDKQRKGLFVTSLHGGEASLIWDDGLGAISGEKLADFINSVSGISGAAKALLIKCAEILDEESCVVSLTGIIRGLKADPAQKLFYTQACAAFNDFPPFFGEI